MKLPLLTPRTVKLTILYKSGTKLHVRAKSFKVTRNSVTGSVSTEWDGLKPGVLLMGVDDVAAVWKGWI